MNEYIFYIKISFIYIHGDWGLVIGEWGLGVIENYKLKINNYHNPNMLNKKK